jgi:RecA-family ATPase
MKELRAIEGERHAEHKPRSASAFTADELAPIPVPRRSWHVEGLIPGRTVTQLGGDGGIGKSTLALQLCCATAVDEKWLGFRTRPGRSLYLSCEDDRDELHRRLDLIALHYKRGLDEFSELKVWPLADQDALLALGDPGRALEPTPLWEDFRAVVADWRPRLIVIDSLADVYGANENDRAHVRAFVRMLRSLAIEHEAAVVILSHPSLAGLTNGSGTSGSTAWHNSVRSRLYLTRPPTDPEATAAADIRLLQFKKGQLWPHGRGPQGALPDRRLRARRSQRGQPARQGAGRRSGRRPIPRAPRGVQRPG